MKRTPKQFKRPYHVNYLEGFWLAYARDIIKKVRIALVHHKMPSLLKGRLLSFKGWLKKKDHTITIHIRWVMAVLLLLGLWPQPTHTLYAYPISPLTPKLALVKPLPEPSLAPVSGLDPIPAPVLAPPSQPAYVAPVTDCGSDPNMAYIYQHESGCRTDAIGPNGPCGLGQALPCSKLPCSLSDWACQNNWFINYAIQRYGSTYAAYLYWTGHSYW